MPPIPDLLISQRVCLGCRQHKNKDMLIRLSVEPTTGRVLLNPKINGRSAYLCRSTKCFEKTIKGNYLKQALVGRQTKPQKQSRRISWPLESQLIKDIAKLCTE